MFRYFPLENSDVEMWGLHAHCVMVQAQGYKNPSVILYSTLLPKTSQEFFYTGLI